MLRKVIAAGALCLALAACVSSTPYGPATDKNPYGFSDQRIETNRYRISFRGNSSTTRETVETYLLYRAAEVTVGAGYDYFIITEQDTDSTKRYSGMSSPAFYGSYNYGFGPYCCGAFPYYAYGWGWGMPYDDFTMREYIRYTAMAYVMMYKGEKPADDPAAFSARSVIENLSGYVAEHAKDS